MKSSRALFVKIAVLVFSVFCFITLVSLQLKNNSLQDEVKTLDARITDYMDYIDELNAILAAPMDEEYVAGIARDKLGLRHPQEVVFYSDDAD